MDADSLARHVSIRATEPRDLPDITRIYEHYVLNATCTFEIEPPDVAEMRKRFEAVKALGAPYLVAEAAGRIAGYAYAGTYRQRPAYRHTIENTVYVAPELVGRGIGRRLLEQLIEESRKGPFRQMIAVVGDSSNEASIRLHERLGFRRVGVLQDVGFKFGRWLDTVLLQRSLP